MNEHNLKEFLLTHENADPALLMLHRNSRPDIDMDLAVKCIRGRQIAKHKMPVWYKEPGLVYPGSLPLEQCSSQATALYKQRFVKTGDKAADMTGGLGIDSWSLSGKAASVDYFEQSEELCRCARHNFRTLGRSNIIVHHTETTLEMLSGIPSCSYNIIYLDPARRNKEGNRVYSLKDCEPDVTILKRELLRIAPRILLKVSPMADIRVLLSELPEAVEIHVVSSENECKEVLVLMERGNAVNPEQIPVIAVDIPGGRDTCPGSFRFTIAEEKAAVPETASPDDITGYLFEPSPALLKSGAFKLPAIRFGLKKISASTHFYTGNKIVRDFPGKVRRIIDVMPFNKAAARDFKKKYPACSVTARNFPMNSETLRKRLGAAESNELRVIGTTTSDNSRILIVTASLQP